MKRIVTAALALSILSGCYTTRVVSPATAGKTNEQSNWYFVNGLTGSDINATECTKGIAKVETSFPWWHNILFGITSGIVDTSTTSYSCVE